MVTTVVFNHATPVSFTSHDTSRTNYPGIASGQDAAERLMDGESLAEAVEAALTVLIRNPDNTEVNAVIREATGLR